MNKLSFALLLVLVFNMSVQAQKYRTAAGIRIGRNDFGFTGQQKILEQTTLEGIASFSGREISATGLLEQHFSVLGRSFNVYLGAGMHVDHLKDNGTFYGGDLLTGVEMKVPVIPFVLSLDLKPTFHINHEEWGGVGGGLSIRYILVKEKKEKKKLFGIFNRKDDDRNNNRSRKRNKNKKTNRWFGNDDE